jgi:hypothetical protein
MNFGQNGLVLIVVKKMEAAEKLVTLMAARSKARGGNKGVLPLTQARAGRN